jgi:hypothetical protein
MELSLAAARRFAERASPAYPSLAALSLALATASCEPRSAKPGPEHVAQGSGGTAASAAQATSGSPAALAGPFAEDELPLDMNVGCKGDCPSPYSMAASRKDEAQVQARAERCSQQHGVRKGAAILRANIATDGRAKDLVFESEEGPLTEAMRACLHASAAEAAFTPPERGSPTRVMFARFHIPRVP